MEYPIRFPIRDLAELIEVVKSLDALDAAAEGSVRSPQLGAEGLIRLLEELQAAEEQPGDAPSGQAMMCPCCQAGTIIQVEIIALGSDAYLCDACEALWVRREEIAATDFITYTAYMQALGRPTDRSEITVKGVIRAG